MRITEIKRMRDRAEKAYLDALDGKSLSMNGRNLTRQDIAQLKEQFDYWDRRYRKARSKGKGQPYSLVNFTGR
ncbi:hypothetical protein OVA10_15675 [Lelliottia sp. SL45]|uniref:hypothetical protein n=1 Tax=Lelliottia sp. SL45 TaxID=2994665 RepID=UPI0022728949|nr:hypothetical protein [Lelliottia sp. SL45]MCY1699486.1 hypothetical protein [Lelliottia sp. SL45]